MSLFRAFLFMSLLAVAGCELPTVHLEPMFAPRLTGSSDLDVPMGENPHPVVLEGEAALGLQGAAPTEIVAFAYQEGHFVPIPVQVDERFAYDLATVYAGMEPRDCARRAWCRDVEGQVEIVGYADPTTHVGPDPNPTVDSDDEVVLMRADFGERASGHPVGVEVSTATEVRAVVGGQQRYAYLYRRIDDDLDPAAGRAYIRYTPDFVRGDYLDMYERGGTPPPWLGWPTGYPSRERLGSNPERTTVETEAYTLGFADRWILNRLHLGNGPDVLDVDMIAFAPGVCWRSPYTGSLSEGGFLVNRSGPVRAIRHVVGFNSGPLVDAQWTFYARSAESRATLRVHAIPGAMSFLDLSADAEGLVYRNEANPRGVLVNGRPDALHDGPVTWESWSGDAGTFAVQHTIETEGFTPTVEPYHLDEDEPHIDACMMDDAYVGAHGLYVRGKIPNTDPRGGEAAHLALHRRFVFGGTPAEAVGVLEAEPVIEVRPWAGHETDA